MAGLINFLCLGLFLGLMVKGNCSQRCSQSDIFVEQNSTGVIVKGKPEFVVTLFNACPCPQAEVRLACKGFRSAEKIDPKVLVISGDLCSLPKGSFLAPFSGYGFNYAWDKQFPLKPIFSRAQC